jgi:hypothetical protein
LTARVIEERPDSFGRAERWGGVRGHVGAALTTRVIEERPDSLGRAERRGACGAMSGPR